MRLPPSKLLRATGLCALILPAGCASTIRSPDPAGHATMSCADLDAAIGETSKSISSVAVARGKIDRLNVPFWVPGGEKAISALKDRRTRKIEDLQEQLAAMKSARQARCP